jgi:hypothetical protein
VPPYFCLVGKWIEVIVVVKIESKLLALVLAVTAISIAPTYANDKLASKSPELKNADTKAEVAALSEVPALTVSAADKAKLSAGQVVVGTQQKPSGRRWVAAKIQIKAPPAVVWEAVHEERKTDPDIAYSKILEEGKNELTLEQKFQLIPVIGTSVCVMKNTEIPGKRIDYYLLKSDRFKALEGSWVLQPTDDGHTILELASYIDMGVPAPRSIIESVASKKLERRLGNVRKAAEKAQAQIAAKGEIQ